MRKLTLDLEQIAVESFDTSGARSARPGTVRGREYTVDPCHTVNPCDTVFPPTENLALSACWGTGCNSGGDNCGGVGSHTDPNGDCVTYTQGMDETCINCTARVAACTEDPAFCY
jgi:hypothetical protein